MSKVPAKLAVVGLAVEPKQGDDEVVLVVDLVPIHVSGVDVKVRCDRALRWKSLG